MLKRFLRRLDIFMTERRMWWRYTRNKNQYEKTRQWYNIGEKIEPATVYEQTIQFVRQTVNLSPRPYGRGAYGLVLAAIWRDSDRSDRWQIEFTYAERQTAYTQLETYMNNWTPPPLCVMVGVLPYGALAEGL